MKLSIVAAVSENGVIGRDGALPWKLPAELRRVKALTMGHCLLMGRKTYESIGRPLPGRTSIVITRDPAYRPEGVVVVGDLDAAIQAAAGRGESEAFVFGGASIYALALPRADRLYLTRVHADVEGDVRFPEYDADRWRKVASEHHPADARHVHAFTFEVYERVGP